MRNPFEYGRALGLDELVDRAAELAELDAVMRNRGKLFLIGPRRFGKTSLLSAAGEAAGRRGALVLRHDAEKYESLALLAGAVLTSALRALGGPLEQAAALLRRVAAGLEPRITLQGETISVGIGLAAEGAQLPLLAESLDAVERLGGETGREVTVILDEVQQIVVEHGPAAERQLRATVQQHRHTGYIFAGSATRLLTAMTEDPDRPFYRLGGRLFLGPVPRAEFRSFLEDSFEVTGLPAEAGACDRILELADEVPYNVQRLAYEVWECARAPRAPVTEGLVGAALERLVRREDPAYTQMWTALTANRKRALKAVVESGGAALFSGAVTRRAGLTASSMARALEGLEENHLVRLEGVLGETRYRLVDPFFATWLRVSQS
jgi:uncharacterized protein